MKRTIAYIFATVAGPRQGFTLMLFDESGFSVAAGTFVSVAIGWVFIFASWAFAGLEPSLTPWLNIPAEEYYCWEAFFVLPVMVVGLLLLSATVQMLSRRLGGNGSFETTARILALSIAVSNLALVLPALGLTVFGLLTDSGNGWWLEAHRAGIWNLVVLILLGAQVIWLGFLIMVSVRVSHKLRNRRSLLVAISAIVVYYGFLLVFLR